MAVSEPILPKGKDAFLRAFLSEFSKALSDRGIAVSEPILPKAKAAFLRALLSESSKALSNPGMAASERVSPNSKIVKNWGKFKPKTKAIVSLCQSFFTSPANLAPNLKSIFKANSTTRKASAFFSSIPNSNAIGSVHLR